MADVLSVLSSPQQAAQAAGGNLLGGAAAAAAGAASFIPGANQAISQGVQALFNNFSSPEALATNNIPSLPEPPDIADISNIYGAFVSNILQNFVGAPVITPLWVCYFENPITAAILKDFERLDINTGRHKVERQGKLNLNQTHNINNVMGGAVAMMFCHRVDLPADTYAANRDTYASSIGGFLPGIVGGNRQLSEITLSFIENNASFVDFVLRPWLVVNTYLGLAYAIKRDITIKQFVRTSPGRPLKIRKTIKIKNAFPVQLDSERLTYTDTNDMRQIQFTYESYTIEGSLTTDTYTSQNSNIGNYAKQTHKPKDPKPEVDAIQSEPRSLLGDLKNIALNVASSLINKQIEGLVSNLFSISPQVVSTPELDRINSQTNIPVQNKSVSSGSISNSRLDIDFQNRNIPGADNIQNAIDQVVLIPSKRNTLNENTRVTNSANQVTLQLNKKPELDNITDARQQVSTTTGKQLTLELNRRIVDSNEQVSRQLKKLDQENQRIVTGNQIDNQPIAVQEEIFSQISFEGKQVQQQDTPAGFILSNNNEIVQIPGNDKIEISNIKTIATENQVKINQQDVSTASLTRPTFNDKVPPKEDTPVYPPYGRSNPFIRPPSQDNISRGSIPIQIKPINKQDVPEIQNMPKQQVAVTT